MLKNYLKIAWRNLSMQEPESQSSQYRKSRYGVNRSKLTIVNRLKVSSPS